MKPDPVLDRLAANDNGNVFVIVGICLGVSLTAVGILTAVAISHSLS